ncbi:autotransporter domain-containing protein [Pseudomonas sp. SWRI51]|uniref:putative Ig domain-containing protein n=1 Tax=Pseudomonas sp. SWRI51 TaxID=2745491 RepID=UPI001647361B|nr:putative Ig domain-containing protein [Pseudomonas sp. SWRI51]MBC3411723.1 autotransporter domain-containing protein [Pseudomonas sp. SWRI51]
MNAPTPFMAHWARSLLALCLLTLAALLSAEAQAVPSLVSPAKNSTLPPAALNQPYSVNFTASPGTSGIAGWYECDINDPSYDGTQRCLPAGLSIAESPGSATTTLTGTPTVAGTYTFDISVADDNFVADVGSYTLVVGSSAAPTLSGISPASGSTAGGTSVTLTGTNLSGATAVTIGGTAATNIVVVNATTITATTPAHPAGASNVAVSTPGGTATLTNAYTYTTPVPTLSSVSPNSGSTAGGTSVTLTGTNLSGATAVSIGGTAATNIIVINATTITATTPAHAAGASNVAVTTPGGTATLTNAYTYVTPAPTLSSINPNSGSTAGGTSVTLTGTNLSGATAVTFDGVAATGLVVNSSTSVTVTTPAHAAGAVAVSITTPGGIATLGSGYTYLVAAPVAGPVSATVAANTSNNTITLSLSGGAASSVAIAGGPTNGTATASGTTITYTPTAGYSGADAFTYTATNSGGTSAPATVTVTVSPPTLTVAPATLPNPSYASAYSQTLTASGGNGSYTYAVTTGALPTGLTLSTAGVLAGTPSATGTFNITVTVTDGNGATASQAYTLTVAAPAVVVTPFSLPNPIYGSAYSQTVTATGGIGSYSYAATGTVPTGLSLTSGGTLSGTPTAAGSFNFTVTATDTNNVSGSRTYTLTIAAPTLSLSPATILAPATGTSYSQTFSVSGGATPYTYAITSGTLPAGLTLSGATVSGTPTTAGPYSFTVTATDGTGFTVSSTYSGTVSSSAPIAGAVSVTVAANSSANPVTLSLSGGAVTSVAISSNPTHGTAVASGTSVTYTPAAGYSGSDSFSYTATGPGGTSPPATVTVTVSAPTLVLAPASASLPDASLNTAYTQAFTVSGGATPYTFAVTSGALPPGLSLNAASGMLSGTPTTAATSSFTITATDSNSATGSGNYTLQVQSQAVVVPPSSETVVAGQSATVDLTRGATGGPFTSATLLSVSPPSAGTARMTGPFTLSFTPAAAFTGAAVVSFSLSNAGGAVASFITFAVQSRPDPSKDPEVIGLLNAQSRAAERFASTQMDNFNRRLEQLHRPTCDRNSFNASVRHGREDVSLGGLGRALRDELEGNGKGRDADDDEKRRQDKDSSRATTGECREDALAYWTDGFVNTGSNRARGAQDNSFTTFGLSAGVDYRLSPRTVVGVGFGYGNDRADIGEHDSRSDGDALGLAAYLSVNPLSQVYVDALLGYNRISFDSRRYVTEDPSNGYAKGSRDADQLFASLTASYEYRHGALSLAPYARVNSSFTRLDAYRERGGGELALAYEEQTLRYFTSFVGVRSGYDIETRLGMLTPRVGLAWGHNFSRNQDYRMRYADQGNDGVTYRLSPDPLDTNFMDLDTGLDLSLGRSWRVGVSYKTALGTNERNEMFRIGLDGKF